MATKTTKRTTLAERKAADLTNFEGVSSWDYSTPAGKRKSALESAVRALTHAVTILLTEAATTDDPVERAVLATVAARKLAQARAFVTPYSGLELPELLR